jgi:hypothetical protein
MIGWREGGLLYLLLREKSMKRLSIYTDNFFLNLSVDLFTRGQLMKDQWCWQALQMLFHFSRELKGVPFESRDSVPLDYTSQRNRVKISRSGSGSLKMFRILTNLDPEHWVPHKFIYAKLLHFEIAMFSNRILVC